MNETSDIRLTNVLWAMVRVGVLGYGGGPSVIPLFRYEAVTRGGWVNDAEFAETLALANVLPGPIATKMAAYLGYRAQGVLGAALAIVAHIVPTCLATVLLFGVFQGLRQYKPVQDMIAAVLPVIAVMLGLMTYEFAAKTRQGLGLIFGTLTVCVAFVLLYVVHVNAAWVVIIFLLYGSIHPRLRRKLQRQQDLRGGTAP